MYNGFLYDCILYSCEHTPAAYKCMLIRIMHDAAIIVIVVTYDYARNFFFTCKIAFSSFYFQLDVRYKKALNFGTLSLELQLK